MVSMVDLIRAGTKKQGARRLKGCIHALAAVAKQALKFFNNRQTPDRLLLEANRDCRRLQEIHGVSKKYVYILDLVSKGGCFQRTVL